jgi:hypothetical protein
LDGFSISVRSHRLHHARRFDLPCMGKGNKSLCSSPTNRDTDGAHNRWRWCVHPSP